jgi:hypothetical protein
LFGFRGADISDRLWQRAAAVDPIDAFGRRELQRLEAALWPTPADRLHGVIRGEGSETTTCACRTSRKPSTEYLTGVMHWVGALEVIGHRGFEFNEAVGHVAQWSGPHSRSSGRDA